MFCRHLLLLVPGCFIAAVSLYAQAPASIRPQFLMPAATISKTVDEVNLTFTVTDKKGRFIGNLRPEDFRLLDNHQRPQRLTFFCQRSDLPLDVAVLIDASASVHYRFRFEQNAAVAFLRKILRPGTDRSLVVTFNNSISVIPAAAEDIKAVSAALKKVKADGDTALNDAVIYACQRLHAMPEKQVTRRAIVLISDGLDTVKHHTTAEAKQEAARSEVTIFALSTNRSEQDLNGAGDAVLKELAAATGGSMLSARNETELGSAFRLVQKALRNQYVLAYNPRALAANGSYHTVELIPLKQGMRANCRKEYYARSGR